MLFLGEEISEVSFKKVTHSLASLSAHSFLLRSEEAAWHGACALMMTSELKMAEVRKTGFRDSAMGLFAVLLSLLILSVSCAPVSTG